MFFQKLRPVSASCVAFSILAYTLPFAHSQTPIIPPSQDGNPSGSGRFWVAELDGGNYMVNLGAIASVAKHSFIVPGVGRVTEVTIDTTGSVAARFYHVNELPIQTPGGIGQSIVDQAAARLDDVKERLTPVGGGMMPWQQVVKNYPDATHAHTVEYRLATLSVVDDLYKSLTTAMQRGRGTTFKGK